MQQNILKTDTYYSLICNVLYLLGCILCLKGKFMYLAWFYPIYTITAYIFLYFSLQISKKKIIFLTLDVRPKLENPYWGVAIKQVARFYNFLIIFFLSSVKWFHIFSDWSIKYTYYKFYINNCNKRFG